MEITAARTYLRRLAVIHLAGLLWSVGVALAALGAPAVGVPLIVLANVAWVVSIGPAWVVAIRRRAGKTWLGPRSVMEDANDLTGWRGIPEAAKALGKDGERIRAQVRAATLSAAALALLGLAISAL